MIKDNAACSDSVGHAHIDSIPNCLQNVNGNAVQYDPGIGLHPNPPLVCGDEGSTESIAIISSRREQEHRCLFVSCFGGGYIRRSQGKFTFAFHGCLAWCPLAKTRSESKYLWIWGAPSSDLCHGSVRDACLQGWPRVARPSKARTKNIGRKECWESQRKYVDRSDGSGREYWRIGRTHQITCHLEISVLITGLDMIGW